MQKWYKNDGKLYILFSFVFTINCLLYSFLPMHNTCAPNEIQAGLFSGDYIILGWLFVQYFLPIILMFVLLATLEDMGIIGCYLTIMKHNKAWTVCIIYWMNGMNVSYQIIIWHIIRHVNLVVCSYEFNNHFSNKAVEDIPAGKLQN